MANFTEFAASPEFSAAVANVASGWFGDINLGFVTTSGNFVFMMQLGFALLTVGCVRAKSAKSVCLKNVMDVCFGAAGYFLFGWGFAYGERQVCDDQGNCTDTNNAFIGTVQFGMADIPDTSYGTWFFQFVFAISTATIVSGAVAERVKFIAYAFYAFFLTAWVYPVLTHWLWSTSGWASTTRTNGSIFLGSGAYDTVGSGAVHMVGGVAGLAGAIIAGPRVGRFINGKPQPMPGHNSVFFMAGVILLWYGFYGFNPGTMGYLILPDGTSYSELVGRCFISTTLGGGFGGCTALILYALVTKIKDGRMVWDLHQAGNGALTGMIVITSGCSTFEPWAAAIGGIVGGLIFLPSSLFFLHICKVDDPVDAVTVHMTGGAVGVWFYALFAKKENVYALYGATYPDGSARHYGWFMGDDATILGANTVWILVIFGWTFFWMGALFLTLRLLGLLRVPDEDQLLGVDISHHGGTAYPAEMNGLENDKGYQASEVELLRADVASLRKRLQALETS